MGRGGVVRTVTSTTNTQIRLGSKNIWIKKNLHNPEQCPGLEGDIRTSHTVTKKTVHIHNC